MQRNGDDGNDAVYTNSVHVLHEIKLGDGKEDNCTFLRESEEEMEIGHVCSVVKNSSPQVDNGPLFKVFLALIATIK